MASTSLYFIIVLVLPCLCLPSEDSSHPSLRSKRDITVFTWSPTEITHYTYDLNLPSVAGIISGFSGGLEGVFTEPYSSRTVQYSPYIDAVLKLVFENYYGSSHFEGLRSFLNSEVCYEIIQQHNIDVNSYSSLGAFLSYLFQLALNSVEVQQNQSWYYAIQYFDDRIAYGGPAPSQVSSITFDFSGILQAFQFSSLNQNVQATQALSILVEYLTSSFDLTAYLHNVEHEIYYTRGEFLQEFFRGLLSCQCLTQEVEESVEILLPYVITTGAGACPVDYKPVGVQVSFASENLASNRPIRKRARKVPKLNQNNKFHSYRANHFNRTPRKYLKKSYRIGK